MDKSSFKLDNSINESNKNLNRKHLAERQRRARINSHLEEIQKLITNKTTTKSTVKPEKAEVLEKAVKFLQNFKTEQVSESESYKQGFSSCMTTILERIPAEFQENEDLKGLKDHLEAFLVNLTTEAETMAYPNTMASGPYIQALSGEWYQQQTGHCVMKSPNQSNDMSQNDWKGSLHSAGNNKANFHSPNLLCSVQETPKWFSEWNTQMQMQYIETYGDQNCEQDVSTYDVFQGIKSIYSNYLQDEEAYCASANEPKECQNNSSVSLKVSGGQTVTPQTSARKPTDLTVNAGNNSQMRRLSDNYDNEKLSIETPNNDTALGRSQQTSSPQLWRPW